jgi:hypothetical protein
MEPNMDGKRYQLLTQNDLGGSLRTCSGESQGFDGGECDALIEATMLADCTFWLASNGWVKVLDRISGELVYRVGERR